MAKWQDTETQFLIDNYKILGPIKCGEILCRNKDAVRAKAKTLGLRVQRNSLVQLYPNIINEWDYGKNDKNPEQYSSGSSTKAWFMCQSGHSYQCIIHKYIVRNHRCPYCSHHRVISGVNDLQQIYPEIAEEFDIDLNNKQPYEYLPHSNTKVWWRCKQYGHLWKTGISHRTIGNTGCPYCSNRKVLCGFNDIGTTKPEWLDEWDYTLNKITPQECYMGSHKKIHWICQFGHKWCVSPNSRNSSNAGCPYCTKSKGEEEVVRLLQLYNLEHIRQKTFSNCKYKGRLRFDFYLENYNCIIEYQGIQHYQPVEFFGNNKGFQDTQIKDEIKRNFCQENNIILIIIPYTDFNNIENILIDNLKLQDLVNAARNRN